MEAQKSTQMKRTEVNKKMKELQNSGLLDNFSKEEKNCLKESIKNQQEFIIVKNNRKETEKSLFKAKQMPL